MNKSLAKQRAIEKMTEAYDIYNEAGLHIEAQSLDCFITYREEELLIDLPIVSPIVRVY